MDVKDQITPSGQESHGVHLCHRCGWPFPNPHPSARHRRAHKKICGTIDGYSNLIGSEVVSDFDKEKTPSPKKMGIGGAMRVSFSRSEDELFSDAVAEFPDGGTSTGSANKTLDRDVFFSFKDTENDEISKVDNTSIEVSEKIDTHVEKLGETEITTVFESSESNLELTEPGLVKDGSIDVMEVEEKKSQESQISETIANEAKYSELTKTTPEGSAIVGGDHDNVMQGDFEKLESAVSGGFSEGIKQEIKSDYEHDSEVVKESETDHLEGVAEELKHENFESDHKHDPEVAKESATAQNVSVLIENEDFGAPNVQIQEVFKKDLEKEPVAVLTEKKDFGGPHLEKHSMEQIQELVDEPNTVLTEEEDLGGPHMEKLLTEHVYKKQDLGAPELEKYSKKQIQEVVKQPDTVLTGKEDLGRAHLEEQSNEHHHEVTEKPDSVLTGSRDLCAPELEKYSKNEVMEQKVDNDSSVVADVSVETVTQQFSSDNSAVGAVNVKNASDVVPVASVEEGKMNKLDFGAALSVGSSTRSSLEGNWGSVSVLSTASIDVGALQSAERSKVNSGKSNATTTDVFERPSFVTLMEAESKEKKPESSEVKDSQKQPNSEVKVNNESEGRKRNEEAIAKVTNWSTAKQSTCLKNLLGEAKSPSGAQDEARVKPSVNTVNDDVSSPPKLIDEDGKKGRKKVKGLSSWYPFVCCSSVNVVN